MQCPRCGVSVFAELSNCRGCGWVLSKPYGSGNGRDEPGLELVEPPAPTPPLNGKRPFRVSLPGEPWQQLLWGSFAPRFRARRRRLRRRGPPAEAIAELSTEAYFAPRPRAIECLEMPVVQTALDFSTAEVDEELAVEAAPLARRLRAGLYDAILIVSATAAFFALFTLLGGRLGLERRDLLMYGLAAFALAGLYFGLFTYFGGQTPGMKRYGLAAIRFDGGPLTRRDARLRAFGYVVSTGSLLVGFIWAVADEQQLTWHDRISRTLITSRPPSQ